MLECGFFCARLDWTPFSAFVRSMLRRVSAGDDAVLRLSLALGLQFKLGLLALGSRGRHLQVERVQILDVGLNGLRYVLHSLVRVLVVSEVGTISRGRRV